MSKLAARPLSPHLTVYRWQWTMLLSVTHRATGIALVGGTLLLTWWLVAAAIGAAPFAWAQWFVGSWFGMLLLIGWTWSLYFHLCNGIRHLVWDTGLALDLPNAERGGYLVAAASVVLTVATWAAGLAAW